MAGVLHVEHRMKKLARALSLQRGKMLLGGTTGLESFALWERLGVAIEQNIGNCFSRDIIM